MYLKKITLLLLFQISLLNAQTSSNLHINTNIKFPQDSLIGKRLIEACNKFLSFAQQPNELNKLVLPEEKIETFILLDEINGIEKNGKYKDDNFYKPYLTNIVPLNQTQYLLQISYIGLIDNTPLLKASFEIMAHKKGDSFLFSSPMLRNTKNWKTKNTGAIVFHYQNTLNESNAKSYATLATSFDKKLNSPVKLTEFYLCNDFIELLHLIGVQYKADYNGYASMVFTSSTDNKLLVVNGSNNARFDTFDAHDLWHDRLSLVKPRSEVNKPVDEGCAYLYGGSWGISWAEILKRFKEKVTNNPQTDWLELKEKNLNFGDSPEKHLMADYVVNALLIQQLEKEKGFQAVWELLNCGKYEKGNENYFKVLEKLTGINKSNYNQKIWELVRKN